MTLIEWRKPELIVDTVAAVVLKPLAFNRSTNSSLVIFGFCNSICLINVCAPSLLFPFSSFRDSLVRLVGFYLRLHFPSPSHLLVPVRAQRHKCGVVILPVIIAIAVTTFAPFVYDQSSQRHCPSAA